jgi:leucyl aminopeptidase
MLVTVDSKKPLEARVDLLALPLTALDPEAKSLPARLAPFDRALSGAIAAAVASGDFEARPGQSLVLHPGDALPARRLLLVGLGEEAKLDAEALRRAAGTAVGEARQRKARTVALAVPRSRRVKPAEAAEALAEGAVLANYRFDAYRGGKKKDEAEAPIKSVALCGERPGDVRAARAAAKRGAIIAESQNLARDLSNEPGNALPPAELARRATRIARDVGLRSRVLDVTEMKRRKMGAILAVGGGSDRPPRMIVLEHNAPRRGASGGRRRPTICLVGKGVTFDSGGISIKPAAAMDEMKHDMSGAAAVVGALRACALLDLPLHVVGVIGAAENLPSGTAYRPGDILTSMSKKTIEVLNTDAEGRVVLADALHYARTEFDPVAMVDLATLTGACVIALGSHASGLFATDDKLAEHLYAAGEATGERLWRMPVWEGHRKAVESKVADVKNAAGREASSSTAAAFLAAFTGDTPWAHLDIAGTAWTSKPEPYQPAGATGVGVRLLVDALTRWKESHVV